MITNEMLDAYDTAILNHSPCADHTCDCGQKFKTTGDWHDHKISTALAAATPHLRAAWEQEMAEKIRAKFLGPDFGRNPVNGQDSPDAALHAAYDEGVSDILTFLEGVRE